MMNAENHSENRTINLEQLLDKHYGTIGTAKRDAFEAEFLRNFNEDLAKTFFYHRGYKGSAAYCEEDDIFYGKIMDVDGLMTYQSEAYPDLEAAFQQAVNEYIDFLSDFDDHL